jgi:hypothetical protein
MTLAVHRIDRQIDADERGWPIAKTPPTLKMWSTITHHQKGRWRMKKLVERFGSAVKGVLTGFDRIVFKGIIRPLTCEEGAMSFLRWRGVLNKDYRAWVQEQSQMLLDAAQCYAIEQCGRGIIPLDTWRHDKDALAKDRQRRAGIGSGLIGVWACQESGRSYKARFCAKTGHPQLRDYRPRCKHLYFYLDDAEYGFMNIRLQTWFPYHIQICMNGRQWLRRQLDTCGIEYGRIGNKFLHLADFAEAQRLLDTQLDSRWPKLLDGFLSFAFPTMGQTLGPHLSYYWTLWQSEWATDLVMDRPLRLSGTMEALLKHAWFTGTSTRVLRYMGRPIRRDGQPYGSCPNEVMSRVMAFHDGVRVRHWVDHNSVKVYNEQNVLRVETTMNNPYMFKVYRRAEGEASNATKKARPIRKGVADIPLRAQVSQEINNRYMDNLSTFSDSAKIRDLLKEPTRAKRRDGRRIRALEPTGKDRELLEAIAEPAFLLSGITNHELRKRLAKTAWGKGRTDKQLSARVSRHLRLLRDHGLIKKIPNRRRYQLTAKGQQLTTALGAILAASTQQLMDMAA